MNARGPRERLISSAIALVRERGVEAAGLADLLERSGCARRSVYQHFPGGKLELIEESTRLAGRRMRQVMAGAGDEAASALVIALIEQTTKHLVAQDFALGCPIAAAAMAPPEASGPRAAATAVFATWTDDLAERLVREGRPPSQARSLAGFVVSSIEGALLRAVAARCTEPLDQAADQLRRLL